MKKRYFLTLAIWPLVFLALFSFPGELEATNPSPRLRGWIESRSESSSSRSASALYPLRGETVVLDLEPKELQDIRWYLLVPDLSVQYQNANFPWEKKPYQWRGHARIEYSRVEIPRFRGQSRVRFRAGREKLAEIPPPTGDSGFWQHGAGAFFFQAEGKHQGKNWKTPGIESRGKIGLADTVMRVCVRAEAGLAGWVTTYFNVPGVFGSVPAQVWNHLGTDCADMLVSALHRPKALGFPPDGNVAWLVKTLKTLARGKFQEGGHPKKLLRWGKDFQSGDFLAVRFEGYRQYGHIGLLWQDADGDGRLSPADIILHCGPWPLQAEALSMEGFDGDFVILRP